MVKQEEGIEELEEETPEEEGEELVFESEEEAREYLDSKVGGLISSVFDAEITGENETLMLQVWRTNVKPILTDITLTLLGYVIEPKIIDTEEGKKVVYVVKQKEKIIDEDGITKILSILKPYVNLAVLFSNLSYTDVMSMIIKVRKELFRFLLLEGWKYGVRPNRWPMIINPIGDFVYSFLTRALDGRERELAYMSIQITLSGEIKGGSTPKEAVDKAKKFLFGK